MRRRLILQAAAVTSMVVLAFIVPLAVLVGDLAADRTLVGAEREAENIARLMAVQDVASPTLAQLEALLPSGDLPYEISIVTPDGAIAGADLPPTEDLDEARSGRAYRSEVPGGQSLYIPVIGGDGATTVIRVFASDSELRRGVGQSWLTLAALGLTLIGIAMLIADWIGRSIVRPVAELSAAAERLGSGDLTARVEPGGPEEIQAVGVEFNRLATQIDRLLIMEREAAADLSHRLRTPLTALRLDAEALPPDPTTERLLEDLDDLERTVDYVIHQARSGSTTGVASAARVDIATVVADRVAFWRVLAEDQGRDITSELASDGAIVAMAADDASATVDALLGNVFAHTPEGSPISVTSIIRSDDVLVAIEDGGPGLPDLGVLERGRSHGSSSGLGLDIARRSVEAAGGDFRIGGSRRLGGAMIVLRLPLTTD
jgi:signal transduction histidine kinase